MRWPMRAAALILPVAIAACGSPGGQADAGREVRYAPDDAYERLKVGMTSAQANEALGVEGLEITASGSLRTLAWSRRSRSNVTANFMRDRLSAKRQ